MVSPICLLQEIVVPVAVDTSLPDYLVRTEQYARAMRVLWQPGDRFRMFFGGKISSKTHKKVKSGEQVCYSPSLNLHWTCKDQLQDPQDGQVG